VAERLIFFVVIFSFFFSLNSQHSVQAATWTGSALDDALPGELFLLMPYMHLQPQVVGDKKTASGAAESGFYSCPLYKTLTRAGVLSTTGLSTNFITELQLPISSDRTESFFVRRGCALIAALAS
jgi:dynein heavy chain